MLNEDEMLKKNDESNYSPLSHLRVLDLTQFLSGPYADNRSILSDRLGLSEEMIDQLERNGAFGTKPQTSAVLQPKRFGTEH